MSTDRKAAALHAYADKCTAMHKAAAETLRYARLHGFDVAERLVETLEREAKHSQAAHARAEKNRKVVACG